MTTEYQSPRDMETITTEQRSDDWIAFANDDRASWESGRTEAEAIGKLFVSLAPNRYTNAR